MWHRARRRFLLGIVVAGGVAACGDDGGGTPVDAPRADAAADAGLDGAVIDAATDAAVDAMVIDAAVPIDAAVDAAIDAEPPGTGDTCDVAQAVILTAGTASIAGTTATSAGYVNDYAPPTACTGFRAPGNDRVYTVTVPAGLDATVTATPAAPSYDVSVYVIAPPAANCDAPVIDCIEGVDRGADGTAETLSFSNTTTGPVDFFVVVDGYATGGAGFTLDVSIAPPAAGETCHVATAVGTGTVTGATVGYRDDYDPPLGCTGKPEGGSDRAYQVTVQPAQTLTATVTPDTNFDPGIYLIAAPAATCDAEPITCLDGADDGYNNVPETVAFTNSTAGPVDVFVVVDSYWTAVEMTYTLSVMLTP